MGANCMSIAFSNTGKSNLIVAVSDSETQFLIDSADYSAFLEKSDDGDYSYAVLIDVSDNKEIVQIDFANSLPHTQTDRYDYSGGLTVARGQGGTQARAWPRGSLIYQDVTKTFLNDVNQKAGHRSISYNPNGVLSPLYKGEKVLQSSGCEIRWWKSINATNPFWSLIGGDVCSGEVLYDPGLGFEFLITPACSEKFISGTTGSFAVAAGSVCDGGFDGSDNLNLLTEEGSARKPYFYQVDTNVTGEQISTSVYYNSFVSLLDSNDKLHGLLISQVGSNLYHATNATGSWVLTDTNSVYDYRFGGIVLDSNNKIHAIVRDNGGSGNTKITYLTNASGSWVEINITDVIGGETINKCSLGIDSNNKLHALCGSVVVSGSTFRIRYLTNVTGSWVVTTIYDDNDNGSLNDMVVDDNDKVHGIYEIYDDELGHITNLTGFWVTKTVKSLPSIGGLGVRGRIKKDSAGDLHIAFSSQNADGDDELYYCLGKPSVETWLPLLFYTQVRSFRGTIGLVIDSNDRAHVLYLEYDSGAGSVGDFWRFYFGDAGCSQVLTHAWEQHLTDWTITPGGKGSWDGSKWNAANGGGGPGPGGTYSVNLTPNGGWEADFFPSSVEITFTGGPPSLTIAKVGGGNFLTNEPLLSGFPVSLENQYHVADIATMSLSHGDSFSITNIRFYA